MLLNLVLRTLITLTIRLVSLAERRLISRLVLGILLRFVLAFEHPKLLHWLARVDRLPESIKTDLLWISLLSFFNFLSFLVFLLDKFSNFILCETIVDLVFQRHIFWHSL